MQPFFPLALSPGDFSLYISRKKNQKTFQLTKSPTSLAKCGKGQSIRACLLPRCGRRQHQVRTSRGCSHPWLMQMGRVVTPQGLAQQGAAETPARACGVSVAMSVFISDSVEIIYLKTP